MKKNRSYLGFAIALIAVVVIVGGIVLARHKTTTMTMPSTSGAVATNSVKIANYAFSPMVIKVKVGTTVTWTNTDAVNHTVTTDSGSMPSSKSLARGESYSYTFAKVGVTTYHCDPHPYMHGTVDVTN